MNLLMSELTVLDFRQDSYHSQPTQSEGTQPQAEFEHFAGLLRANLDLCSGMPFQGERTEAPFIDV